MSEDELKKIKADAVMNFVQAIDDADLGVNTFTLEEIFEVAKIHCEERYGMQKRTGKNE